ncbi:MAG: VIT and VWA domain-containing protein, partial [Planctomycetota bacterium]|nr:VIT and VWA domain-containing protein [Planctomycetota bacterium]
TMVFANPNPRPLAGDLYFPLPEGATVSGYALDVNGVMVDGAVVAKDRGRQVFEKEVRKGIDPGLVEWAKGNAFKTRVFPIPGRGTRTVMVSYVADLVEDQESATYHLPLNFKDKIADFSLTVEVVTSGAEPVVSPGAVANFALAKWEQGYRGQVALQDAALDKDFRIALPKTDKPSVAVEVAENGETYFAVSDFPVAPPLAAAAPKAPNRVTIFWDASASRAHAEREREMGILRAFFKQPHVAAAEVAVDLVIFRHAAEQPRSFTVRNGNAEEAIAALQAVAYDGGTQLGCLAAPAKPDLILLFSDGLSNFGKEEPEKLDAPTYVFCASPLANHAFLRYLALKTGGAYFNLNLLKDEAIIAALGQPVFSFLGAEVAAGVAEECYPAIPRPALGRCAVAGILKAEEAVLTLRYGRHGKVEITVPVRINRSQAVPGDLLRRYWAQKKVDDLMTFQKRNEEAIIEVGKRHGIVTPGTSLIVLETVEQYVEHEITPPKSMPKLLEQYGALMEKKRKAAAAEQAAKIDRVLAMWQERVKWWETEFKVPPGFKYQESKNKENLAGADEGGGEERVESARPARSEAAA